MQSNLTEHKAVASAVNHHAQGTHAIGFQTSQLGIRYGTREVLRDVNLSVTPGQFVAIIGRSGCGKSTLLRLIAGLELPSHGHISTTDKYPLQTHDLRIMFQDPRLLPWKSVLSNVALGLAPHHLNHAPDLLKQVGLAERADEWPARLSGGQKQRVALARALAHRPRLLLLDEPLGALDALTRIQMHSLIESLWQRLEFTALLVTHDVTEAVCLADRVIVIEDGQIAMDIAVDLPRPRVRTHPAFIELESRLLERLLNTSCNYATDLSVRPPHKVPPLVSIEHIAFAI